MKVLIADKFPDAGRQAMQKLGLAVTYEPDVKAEELASRITDHAVLVVRSTKVTADTLKGGKGLQLVIRAGAGVNTIDVATASALGIFVSNTPGKNAIAVAELAMGLLLAVDRRIHLANAELKAGQWNKKEYSKADGLFGKTLGVVGTGEIGREVIARALGFGMRVVAWSRSLTDAQAFEMGVTRAPDLAALAQASDAVSIHVAFNKETKGLIGRAFLAHLKPNAIVINTARDGIVDEEALLEAITERGLRYGCDVFDGEPADAVAKTESKIALHPKVVVTPHVGASTEQAQDAVAEETVRILKSFVSEGDVPNCVNLCAQSPARFQLNVRHLDKVGVLASVLGAVREAGINVEEVENIIFDGAKAACARIRLANEPSETLVTHVEQLENVIGVQVVTVG